MKKLILITILSLLCVGSFAQKIRFTNNTNTWSMIDSNLACCIPYPVRYTTAHYEEKVAYHNHTYQTLVYDLGVCLVREDAGKVYVIGTLDSVERVMYDFNLGLDDTLRLNYPESNYVSWVSELDSTQLYGKWYKVWHFDGIASNTDSFRFYKYNVIEGIGCTNGVYYPAAPYDLAAYSDQLLCFTNDMGLNTGFSKPVLSYGYDYSGAFENLNSCNEFHAPPPPPPPPGEDNLNAKQLSRAQRNAVVVPNPVTESSKIVLPYSVPSGSLVITNSVGQFVAGISFENKDELPVGSLTQAPGIYFYRVTDNAGGAIFAGKFVQQ